MFKEINKERKEEREKATLRAKDKGVQRFTSSGGYGEKKAGLTLRVRVRVRV